MENNVEKLVYSVKEAAKVLGVSEISMYDMCNRSNFPAIRVGKNRGKIVIPVEGLKRWLENGGAA